jgi:uncharacterized DUF497 family protein
MHYTITYDPGKRTKNLEERGLDFEDVGAVFAKPTLRFVDNRFDYGEERIVTIGYLNNRMVVIIWTARGNTRHIISMRKANDREQRNYEKQF